RGVPIARRSGNVFGDAACENHSLDERVGRKAVGAVKASGGDLAASPKTRKRCPPTRVGVNAAPVIVGGGRDRDGGGLSGDARCLTNLKGCRKRGLEVDHPAVEESAAAHHDLTVHRASHNVPGRKLRRAIGLEHKPLAFSVDEKSALAAHGL